MTIRLRGQHLICFEFLPSEASMMADVGDELKGLREELEAYCDGCEQYEACRPEKEYFFSACEE